jgi:hypothetical protein
VTVNDEGARRLELFTPLVYSPAPDLLPFVPAGTREGTAVSGLGERLFCFALDEAQSRRIEPDSALLLGPLTSAGFLAPGVPPGPGGTGAGSAAGGERLELPRGRYLFAQERGALDREGVLAMAIEVQKDGLWERLHLDGRLYVRYLYEDRSAVTQVFRPYRD